MPSITPVGSFNDYLDTGVQDPHGDMAYAHVSLEKKDSFGAAADFFRTRFFVWRLRRGWHARKIHFDGRAFAFLALNTQMSAALMDNAVTSRQTQAASTVSNLRSEKGLEEMRFDLLGHSCSGVGYTNDNIFAGSALRAVDRAMRLSW